MERAFDEAVAVVRSKEARDDHCGRGRPVWKVAVAALMMPRLRAQLTAVPNHAGRWVSRSCWLSPAHAT